MAKDIAELLGFLVAETFKGFFWGIGFGLALLLTMGLLR